MFGLTSVLSIAYGSTTVAIDQPTSSFFVAPWYFQGSSDSLEKYPISGTFNLILDNNFPGVDRVRFEPINIFTPILPRGPFTFPEYAVEFDDINFSGNGDPCNFWSGPGTCYSMGNFGYYSGTFDGEYLNMIGSAPIDFYDSYHFSINAAVTITPVPEPATILLLASGLIGLVGYGRRKFS